MIKHLRHPDINKNKWDECIDRSFNGIIYAYSWYLDIVTNGQWEALVEDDYQRVFPFFPQQKHGISYVFQPFAVQQLGVFSVGKLDQEKVAEFLLYLHKKYKIININLNVNNRVSGTKFEKKDLTTYHLDLISPYSIIRKSFSTNHKRNIKKSYDSGLVIVKSIKPDKIFNLFKTNKGQSNKKLQSIDYDLYRRLVHAAIYQGKCATYGVLDKNRNLIAGAIFFHSHKHVIYAFSGINEKGKELRAMFFLLDSFIQEHQNRNLLLDFEGSNVESIAHFYKGFGANKILYPNILSNRYPEFVQKIMRLIKQANF
jgi:hypothetical protein